MQWMAEAPSNIALIKYMGKEPVGGEASSGNRPTNASLSYTLDHLRTRVRIEPSHGAVSEWAALDDDDFHVRLSEAGRTKFLKFFDFLCDHWQIKGVYKIVSGNNFPSDCGLASSASSFAALTRATYALAKEQGGLSGALSDRDLSAISRLGSGSSCRSFFSPWAEWKNESASPVDLNLRLHHQVFIVEDARKEVSSSQAHQRVLTSLNFSGRKERAERRISKLTEALKSGDWPSAFETTWAEFWDMHALFETSRPSFGYMSMGSLRVLSGLKRLWRERGDGPLVTMDAGANVHALYREDQISFMKEDRAALSEGRVLSSVT